MISNKHDEIINTLLSVKHDIQRLLEDGVVNGMDRQDFGAYNIALYHLENTYREMQGIKRRMLV